MGLEAGKFLGERPAFFSTLIYLYGVFVAEVCSHPSGPWKCCPAVPDARPERAVFPRLQPESPQLALLTVSQDALERG